jgi:hypothetical protein
MHLALRQLCCRSWTAGPFTRAAPRLNPYRRPRAGSVLGRGLGEEAKGCDVQGGSATR